MPDIEHLEIDGKSYDIADSVAREGLNEINDKVEDIKNSSANGLSTELKTRYDTATLQAMYNEVIEPSPEEWFTFDSELQTITGLNEEYAEEYSGVTKLVFPYMIGGKSVKKIGEFAFLPEIDGSWLTSIPSMVNDIRLPNCIDSIGNSAFSNAPIKSINIPTSCYKIEDYAFEFCQSLEEVITPIKPNWELVIGGHAFFQCFSLINIDTIIDGVKEISEGAFGYTDVENVIIPESVDVINRNAFEDSSLRYITILNKNCNINNSHIGSSTYYLELIKGYKGSTAETYAKNNGIPFMSIEGTEVLDKADKPFYVDVTINEDFTVTSEVTYGDIQLAYESGKDIYVRAVHGGGIYYAPLHSAFNSGDYIFELFLGNTQVRLQVYNGGDTTMVGNWNLHITPMATQEYLDNITGDIKTSLGLKADKVDTYTIAETNDMLSTKVDKPFYADITINGSTSSFTKVTSEVTYGDISEALENGKQIYVRAVYDNKIYIASMHSIAPYGYVFKVSLGTTRVYIKCFEYYNEDERPWQVELDDVITSGYFSKELDTLGSCISSSIEKKADKTIIKPDDETENIIFDFSDMYNSEKRLHTVSAVSIKFVDNEYAPDYISGLSFDSGETPTGFDYTDSGIINWVGTDCVKEGEISIFQPSPNTHYDIVFYFNGRQFIGLVNGFVPANGNVVSE